VAGRREGPRAWVQRWGAGLRRNRPFDEDQLHPRLARAHASGVCVVVFGNMGPPRCDFSSISISYLFPPTWFCV